MIIIARLIVRSRVIERAEQLQLSAFGRDIAAPGLRAGERRNFLSRKLTVIDAELVNGSHELIGTLVIANRAAFVATDFQRLGRIGCDQLRRRSGFDQSAVYVEF